MARFLADENFPLPVVEELRRLGHDVVTIADAGKAGESLTDEAILLLATADVRARLTLNRKHFVRLHTSVPHHAGIIVCTLDLDFAGQAGRIHAAITPQTALAGYLVHGGGRGRRRWSRFSNVRRNRAGESRRAVRA